MSGEDKKSLAELHKKIREGSERVVFMDKDKVWPDRSIDPTKIEYRYREVAEIQDAAYTDGKKDVEFVILDWGQRTLK